MRTSVVSTASASALGEAYPALAIHGVVGDFERHLDRRPQPLAGPRLLAFPGGTIGTVPPGSRLRFLRPLADRERLMAGLRADFEADQNNNVAA